MPAAGRLISVGPVPDGVQCPDPRDFQPRLSAWGHAWRLLVMVALSGVVWAEVRGKELEIGDWYVVLDFALGLAAFVLVHLRRRWPVLVAVLTAVMGAFSGIAAGPGSGSGGSRGHRS